MHAEEDRFELPTTGLTISFRLSSVVGRPASSLIRAFVALPKMSSGLKVNHLSFFSDVNDARTMSTGLLTRSLFCACLLLLIVLVFRHFKPGSASVIVYCTKIWPIVRRYALFMCTQGLKDIDKLRFRVVDAKGEVVGRLASQIATVLMGKDKPTYVPWRSDGDVVVVLNAKDIQFTGRKWDQKLYRWHTGYPGGLKQRTAKDAHSRDPTSVLKSAVMGMLPKNNLRKEMARKLRIYPGPKHDISGVELVPMQLPPRKLRDKEELFILPEGFEPFNPEAYWKRFGSRIAKMKEKEVQHGSQKDESTRVNDEGTTIS